MKGKKKTKQKLPIAEHDRQNKKPQIKQQKVAQSDDHKLLKMRNMQKESNRNPWGEKGMGKKGRETVTKTTTVRRRKGSAEEGAFENDLRK